MEKKIKTNSIRAVVLALRKEQKPLISLLNGLRQAKANGEKTYTRYGTKETYVVSDKLINELRERVLNIHEYIFNLNKIGRKTNPPC